LDDIYMNKKNLHKFRERSKKASERENYTWTYLAKACHAALYWFWVL